MKEIRIDSLSTINQAAQKFVEQMGDRKVFALYGEMGAGKTTFVKAICEALGVTDTITSPTFAIVNEYHAETTGNSIFHFDFYRINKIEEAYDFGYEDYFFSGNICFIEWPERVDPLLPDDCVRITITVDEDESRNVRIDE